MKEHLTRKLRTIDGPHTAVSLTLIESEKLYVSIKIGDEVHVVDAVHFMWAASDMRMTTAYQKANHSFGLLREHYLRYQEEQQE